MSHKPPKMVIVVRMDLKDKKGNPVELGKLGVQVSHASHWWLNNKISPCDLLGNTGYTIKFSDEENEWMTDNLCRKILVGVGSERELEEIYQKATGAGLTSHLITDAGLTVFAEPTKTVVGIGPHYGEKFDGITNHLKLLK